MTTAACIGALLSLAVIVQTIRVEHYREQLRKRGDAACVLFSTALYVAKEVRRG